MPDRNLSVILLCPTGQDASLIASVLHTDEINSDIVLSINELCGMDFDDAGVIVIAEEALSAEGVDLLNDKLIQQRPWSDIPLILLTSGGPKNKTLKFQRLEGFVASGNVTILERPFQQLTLTSATQVALRSRRRQFLVRDLLIKQVEATNIRDEFISIASHELKTPLTSLKLQTQMAKKQLNRESTLTTERINKQLDYTVRQIDRLNKLVDDMLDVSRIGSGKLIIQRKTISLTDLIKELIERFEPQFEAVGCTLEANVDPGITGNWDSYKIEQVINNLFSNAIRYSPQEKIEVSLKSDQGKAVISVKDNGPGIEAANLERIFERFERASDATSGLGLGLYITKQIVSLHKGRIHVESEVGKGTNFIVELPVFNEPA
jgi:signal transduction histidine kinase